MNCQSCGAYSGNYPLCRKCYYLSKDGKLKKCEKCGRWHLTAVSCDEAKKMKLLRTTSFFGICL